MPRLARHASVLLGWSLLLTLPVAALAQVQDPDPARFAEAISRFEQWDTQNAFPARGILFVGSSSIVRWPTVERFPGLPVINRGFGGSHISDVNHFIEETVLKYDAEVIVFYAGNNDIAGGKTPEQVLEDYREFAGAVRASGSTAHIVYISIHPSPSRWERWPAMREANELIRAFSETTSRLHYVDIATPMLGAGGEPAPHLFVEDRLHLSTAGYDLWTPIVARAIEAIGANQR